MGLKEILPLLVQGSLFLIVAAVGLQSRWLDLTYVFRHPRLLLRGLVAVNVVVPLVAILVLLMLPVAPMVKLGIVLMAVSPLAPFTPGKMLKAGSEPSYVVGLYVALVLASVIVVPVTVELLSAIFPTDITIPVSAIATLVLSSVLLPLAVGSTVGTIWPSFAQRASRIATIVAYAILLPVAALALYAAGGKILALVGVPEIVAIVVIVAAALAAGHWLGGPEPAHRMALAQAASTRHPGIAGLIAHRHFGDQPVILAILLFMLTSIVVSAIYNSWAKKHYASSDSPKPRVTD